MHSSVIWLSWFNAYVFHWLFVIKVLQRRQGISSGGLTIKELNDFLDRLATGENRFLTTDLIPNELLNV